MIARRLIAMLVVLSLGIAGCSETKEAPKVTPEQQKSMTDGMSKYEKKDKKDEKKDEKKTP